MLADMSLRAFDEELATPATPAGGGCVAAYSGSLATSLIEMVLHLTIGKAGFEGGEDELRAQLAAAQGMRARLIENVDADAEAYLGVVEACRLPKASEEERAARMAAVRVATLHAAAVPLATAEVCLEVLELARDVSRSFNTATASDLGVAVQSALTGVRGGVLNVEINLQGLGSGQHLEEMLHRAAEAERRAEAVFGRAWPALRGLTAGAAPTTSATSAARE